MNCRPILLKIIFFSDLQALEDALTFFGQSFLFTMKLLFCRISFGQMRRQIIDLVIGKRIVSIVFDLWYTKELIMHWYYVAMMQRIKNNKDQDSVQTNLQKQLSNEIAGRYKCHEPGSLFSWEDECEIRNSSLAFQMCWISRSCSDRIELDYKLTWKNVPPDGTVSRGSRFLSLLMREASSWEPPEGLSPHDSMWKKAYLNLTSTYTIHLARDTGMRRHSYKIGIPGEFHINYVLRESHYNECLTTKNSLHCGILDSSSSAWSISTDVSKLHCNHIGTLDAIASPAAPTKTLTVDQLEAFNAAKSALPTPLCYTTPPDSQNSNSWQPLAFWVTSHAPHLSAITAAYVHVSISPRFITPWNPHNQASHDGNGPWYSTVVLVRRKTDRRDLRRSGGGQMLYDNRPSVWVLTSGGGRAYSGKGSLFYPARDIQYQFSLRRCSLQNAAEDLLAKKTTIVGTLRRNKKEVPSELTEARGREVGSSLFCFDRQLTLVSYIPKRKKCVLLLSTMHHDDAVNEDQEGKPDIVLFYNETKSGVDTLDQLVRVYTCKRRTRRWPMVLWFNTLDCAGLAAYVIWTCKNPDWNARKSQRRRLFLMECGKNLVDIVLQKRAASPPQSLPYTVRKAIEQIGTATSTERSEASKEEKHIYRRCVFCGRKRDKKVKSTCISCRKPCCNEHLRSYCEHCDVNPSTSQ
ncbi:PiggyBac transposable element-derived protein 4 [Trichinella britovi]|uniref:PiggyBac transposable element-derived protein 4 n=1 Tax=Trichinella britovi TaxID=45882 RepID=A0A0V1CMH9_TRIBR|nr:PiggyBac transposable element-derived protein 4 [Trichinella britovi]